MIPLNPTSAYTRSHQFVDEEWDRYFSDGRADAVEGGWKAILYANYALINPQKAYEFFADPNFNTPLDGGASRTWYVAYTAALLGVQKGVVQADLWFNNTQLQDTNYDQPVQSSEPQLQSQNELLPAASPAASPVPVPVPEDSRPWPHGFDWPQAPSASTTAPRPTVQPTQNGAARPSPTPITNEQTSFNEDLWVPTPSPSPPSDQQQANPPEAQQPEQQFESPDMSWALQDKDADEDGD
jgi:endo-1,3(4)-beta-glucanase